MKHDKMKLNLPVVAQDSINMFVIIDFLGELQKTTQKAGYNRAKLSWDGDVFILRAPQKSSVYS